MIREVHLTDEFEPEIAEGIPMPPDLVKLTVSELDRPGFTDISGRLRQFPAMSELLKVKNLVFDQGYHHDWRHWSVSYPATMVEIPKTPMVMSPARIVDSIKQRRNEALCQLVELWEETFQKENPGADLSQWKFRILKGWWLHETVVERTDSPSFVIIDSTCNWFKP